MLKSETHIDSAAIISIVLAKHFAFTRHAERQAVVELKGRLNPQTKFGRAIAKERQAEFKVFEFGEHDFVAKVETSFVLCSRTQA